MGSELLLATAELNVDRATAKERVAELTADQIVDVFESAQLLELHEDATPDELRESLLDAVDTAYSDFRDITRLSIRGVELVQTGGLTWGDTPSESFDAITLVAASKVTLQATPDPTAVSEGLNWLHSLIQELENDNTELPMGDYGDVYKIIEDTREALSPTG